MGGRRVQVIYFFIIVVVPFLIWFYSIHNGVRAPKFSLRYSERSRDLKYILVGRSS